MFNTVAAVSHRVLSACICMMATLLCGPSHADDANHSRVLYTPDIDAAALTIKSNTDRQSHQLQDDGMVVTIAPGEKATPTIFILPNEGVWDLSDFGHITAMVTNLDTENPLRIHMRVDNAGNWQDKPWNTEVIRVLPGKTQPLKVMFGHHYGFKPGFKLDPSKVEKVALFIEHPEKEYSYRIDSVVAAGPKGEKPQINPEHVRVLPKDGVIVDEQTDIGKTLRLTANQGVARVVDGAVSVEFSADADNPLVAIRPQQGAWNLNQHLQVSVTLTNTGESPTTPRVWLETSKGDSDVIAAGAPIAVGQSATVVVPFRSKSIWQGPQTFEAKPYKGEGGTVMASNAVKAVFIAPGPDDAAAGFRVERIVAGMPSRQSQPEWLGKRPPVDGNWSLTFEDNFDKQIDPDVWNIYTSNFWDKKSHFSKDNVIVKDGVVKLRFEKKTGHHNDDPQNKVTDYATGFLDTYGKWTQRYGYFEARMKLPDAPGLWPAFWLMPDRGVDAGPQWKRADTGNGGMEFDIMEHLTRWGPNRFTVAFHWDVYLENHKASGTPVYFQPDEDGYVTTGLLWLPGQAVIYTNGVESARWDHDRISNVKSNIIFTAVSGGWDNDPIDDSKLPSDFVIDYVRVWQRIDLMEHEKKPADGGDPADRQP